MFRSADTYGNRSKRLPWRLANAEEPDASGVSDIRDKFDRDPKKLFRLGTGRLDDLSASNPRKHNSVRPGPLSTVAGFSTLFGQAGADGLPNSGDEPAAFYFSSFEDFRFGMRELGVAKLGSSSTQTLGPWLPKNHVRAIASLADKPNIFSPFDTIPDPILPGGGTGSNFMPYRAFPLNSPQLSGDNTQARGGYVPSAGLVKEIRAGDLDSIDINFKQSELAWNRGASQQDEKELKEAYIDAEFLDSRLWSVKKLLIGRPTTSSRS